MWSSGCPPTPNTDRIGFVVIWLGFVVVVAVFYTSYIALQC